ncbi:vanadium-dependent haloperoxidase [Actinoplanes sp. NPDC023936]|uniref:vanadium-dependent haloperoxidase n=1 Tax=Actinoplanes sp. NPDC023936 TaxID=3154910 RepID=UPI0033CC30CC
MIKLLVVTVTVLNAGLIAVPATGVPATRPDIDSVRTWNELAVDAVRLNRATDADAARLYAMVGVAVFDAINGITRQRTPGLVPATGPHHADQQAAAAAAAHAVLTRLDPARSSGYDAQLTADLGELGATTPAVTRGAAWGDRVGEQVVAARTGDGSTPVASQPAGSGPGVFRAAWSGVQYRDVAPFAADDPARYAPGPPPALTSSAYADAFAEVAVLGDAGRLAPELLATYQFWSLPPGSSQPPGEWLRIALTVSADRHLPLAEQARLTALLTMALADTTVATVATKYAYRHWRPTTAIREADTDGNAATAPDPAWSPRAGSAGGSPEYVSGHSSYSGAGATVLAAFFHRDHVTFRHATDSAPGGVARAYPSFSAAAAEAGVSRIYGGQHFGFSNRAGLALGRAVATEVVLTSLR